VGVENLEDNIHSYTTYGVEEMEIEEQKVVRWFINMVPGWRKPCGFSRGMWRGVMHMMGGGTLLQGVERGVRVSGGEEGRWGWTGGVREWSVPCIIIGLQPARWSR
jgi:hypothetical protein